MEQTIINDVKFNDLFEDSSEKYFYQFAMNIILEKGQLELSSLEGDFLKHLYGLILQNIYMDYCNIVYDSGYEYDYSELEYPLDESTISIFHECYFCENEYDSNQTEITDKQSQCNNREEIETFNIFEDIFDIEMTDKQREYYNRIEEFDKYDLLEEMINYIRPMATSILCENYSTSILYSAFYCSINKKTVLVEETDCDGEICIEEESVNYESFEEYMEDVNACASLNDVNPQSSNAFAWIDNGMKQYQ